MSTLAELKHSKKLNHLPVILKHFYSGKMALDKMPVTATPNDLAFALIVAMLSKEPRQLQLLQLSPVLSP